MQPEWYWVYSLQLSFMPAFTSGNSIATPTEVYSEPAQRTATLGAQVLTHSETGLTDCFGFKLGVLIPIAINSGDTELV